MSEASGTPAEPADSTALAEIAEAADAATRGTVTGAAAAAVVAAPAPQSAPRAGVPVWRVGKPDAFLAADAATARAAVLTIAGEDEIGRHLGARSEGVRCVTHLFESTKPGYRGWVWFATLARVARAKAATVNEVGLLPGDGAVLAPAWLPWAERVRPEDAQQDAGDGAAPSRQEPHDDDAAFAPAEPAATTEASVLEQTAPTASDDGLAPDADQAASVDPTAGEY
ncbi:DUF3027 domain-containing protein [Specibacter sp. NPDC057265]|uniref:DUF3027 domain-containing protein n=1 Tax=Specibacter sp. NPDC057265 TaxID=3346075 RepID=UPI00362D5025